MGVQFRNNASSTLAAGITAVQATITIQTADQAEFPTLAGGDWFPVTVVEDVNMEIMRCTARSGATLTVTRGQEGTAARAFSAGARVDHRLTQAALEELASAAQILAKLLTVDGAGSGLDADLLDGQSGAFYSAWANLTGKPVTFPPTLPIAESDVTNLVTDLAAKAPLANPIFTGDARAVTPAAADNDTSIATSAFVKTAVASGGTAERRNRIVNPAMQISQQNVNAPGGNTWYPADQWTNAFSLTTGVMAAQRMQSATPNGSTDRLQVKATTAAAAPSAAQYSLLIQAIEGQRIADLQWGTATAKKAMLRFGFKGPAGTYYGALRSDVSAPTHSYVFPIVISAGQANTDTEQVVSIPGPTVGTFAKDATCGLALGFAFACGSTFLAPAANSWQAGNFSAAAGISNGAGVLNNTFEIFDVGLYADPLNTGLPPRWEAPEYGAVLRDCQRYYWKLDNNTPLEGNAPTGNCFCHGQFSNPVQMRIAPATSPVWTNPSNIGQHALVAQIQTNAFYIRATATAGRFFETLAAGCDFDARM